MITLATYVREAKLYQKIVFVMGSLILRVGAEPRLNFFMTLCFQLEDEGVGGRTVFPHVGVSARPVKGSVVTWFNILSDGSQDKLAFHGGCPVVLGRRTVAATSLFHYDQFKGFPCHKEQGRRLHIF